MIGRQVALSLVLLFFFFSSRRRHTRWTGDWSSDVCSSDLSLSGQQFPAVTVPFGRNTGLSAATFSIVVPGRGPSSALTTDPSGNVTGVISRDRKSTRLNSSHPSISYAVFCLKKKKKKKTRR